MLYRQVDPDGPRVVREHRKIVVGLGNGDPGGIEGSLRRHIAFGQPRLNEPGIVTLAP